MNLPTSLSAGVALICLAGLAHAQEPSLAEFYGFRELEVSKLTERSNSLVTGDFNHDGLTDLAAIDNSHSRIDLLLQRKSPTDATPAGVGAGIPEVNAVANSGRFDQQKLGVDQELAALAVADFNGDGRDDIAYFGNPDRLIVRFQPEQGEWTGKFELRIPDVAPAAWMLTAGDLNHDGKADLAVLGKSETWVFLQKQGGKFGTPVKLLNTSDKLGLVQIADLNGDGRNDLCYLAGDGLNRTLCTRLQDGEGRLGPEYVFDLERPRAVSLKDVDGLPGAEILTVDSRTGRIKLLKLETVVTPAGQLPERLIHYGFGKAGTGRDREVALTDLNGDRLTDVAVSDPEGSRMLVFLQRKGGGLDLGTPFPGLSGTDLLRAGDLDGRGASELVVHSSAEKTLGVSRLVDGRLQFPRAIPAEGDVVGLELADLNADGRAEMILLLRVKKGRETTYAVQLLKAGDGENRWETLPVKGEGMQPFELNGTPERLLATNLTGDARPELVILQGTSKRPQVFAFDDQLVLKSAENTSGPGLPSVAAGAVTVAELGGKSGLLVAQENFARFLVLGEDQRWQVIEQFNVSESNARVAAAAAVDLDGQPGPEIILVDPGVKKLRILLKQESGYLPWKEIDLGDFPFESLQIADLNGDARSDVLVFGADRYAVLYSGGEAPTVKELASFESQLEKVYPTDVVAGDLNGDGHVDLVMTDTRAHFIELLQFRPETGLKHALYFRLFEEKSFANDRVSDTEPREALVVDVTGDGRADLVLLTHDRLLVYPQDDGK